MSHISAKDLQARARFNPISDRIELYFIVRSKDSVSLVTDWVMTTTQVGEEFPEAITVSMEFAQQLMDQLWDCGLRPAEGAGSAGSLKATENHLKDMQTLAWRLLKLLERPEELTISNENIK